MTKINLKDCFKLTVAEFMAQVACNYGLDEVDVYIKTYDTSLRPFVVRCVSWREENDYTGVVYFTPDSRYTGFVLGADDFVYLDFRYYPTLNAGAVEMAVSA